MPTNSQLLRSILDRVIQPMREISDSDAMVKPGPDKWSRKEILGHLIDSACNNHGRFVIASEQDDLVFDGYAQEHWVRFQVYQTCKWNDLVQLWELYNRHLAHVMEQIPTDVLNRESSQHSYHKMGWKKAPEGASTTLDYLVKDYLGHMEHHLRQILPDYVPQVAGTYEYEQTAG